MKYKMQCGCEVETTEDTLDATIYYCPKHAAVDDMYEALKQYERMGILNEFPTFLQGLKNILASAEEA